MLNLILTRAGAEAGVGAGQLDEGSLVVSRVGGDDLCISQGQLGDGGQHWLGDLGAGGRGAALVSRLLLPGCLCCLAANPEKTRLEIKVRNNNCLPWQSDGGAGCGQGDEAAPHVENEGKGEEGDDHDGQDDAEGEVLPDPVVLHPDLGAHVESSEPEE